MRKNCSSDREKLLKFEAEGREFAKFLRSLEQFYSNSERSEQVLVAECFFCSWRFLRSNKLEQLEFKLEKFIGISKSERKVRKKKFVRLKHKIGHFCNITCQICFGPFDIHIK